MNMLFLLIAAGVAAALWLALRAAPAPARKPVTERRPAPASPPGAQQPHDPQSSADPARDELPAAISAILAQGAAELASEPPPELLAEFTWLRAEDLDEARRATLLAALAAIPLPPRSAQVLLSHEFLANSAPRELADLVAREPLLAAKVIGRVNSAFYGLSSPITSVSHAITFLGMNAVRNLALQFTLEQAFASDDPGLKAHHARLFDAGTIAAELCSLLGGRLGFREVGAMSTQVVLSFLGDLAMPGLMPRRAAIENWQLGLLERTCHEQVATGVNAGIIGELLMAEWGMPAAVTAEVRAIQAVLVNPVEAADPVHAARVALCYACCRLSEAIVLGRVRDAAALELVGDDSGDTYYLRGYLELPALARLEAQLRAPAVRMVVSRWIAATAANRPARRMTCATIGPSGDEAPFAGGDTVIQPRFD